MAKNFEDIFIRFGATHERDRQTDGRTDRHRVPAIAALMHSIARQKSFLHVTRNWLPHKEKMPVVRYVLKIFRTRMVIES